MCGLLGSFNTSEKKNGKTKEANKFIIDQFEDQYSRGTKGFGIIRIGKKMDIEIDRACEPAKFLLDLYVSKSSMIIAHHRTPTSTDNKLEQTHPMFISNKILEYDYLIVHNGVVSNDKELHRKHEELGFLYKTEYQEINQYRVLSTKFNDSEALAIELALFIEERIDKIGSTNSGAFIILQINKKTNKAERVFFGKNASGMLMIDKRDNMLNLSSEGIGDEVEPNKLFSFDPKDPTMALENIPLPFLEIVPTTYPSSYPYTQTDDRVWNSDKHQWEPPKKTESTTAITTTTPTPSATITPAPQQADEIVPLLEDQFITNQCKELIEELKEQNTLDISNIIDQKLDDMHEIVDDIVTEYRNFLLEKKTDKSVEQLYIQQVSQVIKTMRTLSNIAARAYSEQWVIEEDALLEDDKKTKKTLEDFEGDHVSRHDDRRYGSRLYHQEEMGY